MANIIYSYHALCIERQVLARVGGLTAWRLERDFVPGGHWRRSETNQARRMKLCFPQSLRLLSSMLHSAPDQQ